MKNVQVIDGLIFPDGTDIAFIDEVVARHDSSDREAILEDAFNRIWSRRIRKTEAIGIHGILFYELERKKQYYPNRRDEEADNPDGTRLR